MTDITYLGHSNFLMTTKNGINIALDPWITGNPSYPKNFSYPNIDYVLLTHGHSDHMGDTEKILKENKNAKLLCQFELGIIFSKYFNISSSKIISLNIGGEIKLDENLFAKSVFASHSSSVMINNEIIYAGDPMGFIINDNGFIIYYAGDTAYTSEMEKLGNQFKIDVAILPVGGKFTMDSNDAIFAMKDLKAKNLVPMHYGTFSQIDVDMQDFEKKCKENNINLVALELSQTRSF